MIFSEISKGTHMKLPSITKHELKICQFDFWLKNLGRFRSDGIPKCHSLKNFLRISSKTTGSKTTNFTSQQT